MKTKSRSKSSFHTVTAISSGAVQPGLLENLTSCHPFTKQLDIVFPASAALEKQLSSLVTRYGEGKVKLSALLDSVPSFGGRFSSTNFTCLSFGSLDADDVWCLDERGLLTLALTKDTYEQLGLVAVKCDSRRLAEHYVVQINTHDRTSHSFKRAKKSFQLWDERREKEGHSGWDIIFHSTDGTLFLDLDQTSVIGCESRTVSDVHIPTTPIHTLTKSSLDDESEDWHDEATSLYEWIGMVGLGSERLKAYDSVNPYIAVYDPPNPTHLGSLTHLRWLGFLPPLFIKLILETTVNAHTAVLNAPNAPTNPSLSTPGFVAITASAYTDSPVTFISPKAFKEGASQEVRNKPPSHAVDCWSLVLEPSSDAKPVVNGQTTNQVIVPSVENSAEIAWMLASIEC